MNWRSTTVADLRFAIRLLSKSRGFTAVAVATLALGIGANTAIWSVVDAVLLHPLPYHPGGEVVVLGEQKACCDFALTSPANLLDYQRDSASFAQLAATMGNAYTLNRRGTEPLFLLGVMVTSNYFDVFGVPALLGRTLAAAVDHPGGPCAAVLSYEAWRRDFGADRQAVGTALQINDHPCTLVGVMPGRFSSLSRADLWVGSPLAVPTPDGGAAAALAARRDLNYLRPVGRLRQGVTLAKARTEMVALSRRLALAFPNENAGKLMRVRPLSEWVIRGAAPALWMLLAAVVLILLIACANLVGMLLARGTVREREMALRVSLGASRRRLVRQLLTETLVLAALGGGLGVLLAAAGLRLLTSLGSEELPRIAEVDLRPGALVATAAAVMLAGVLSGLAPAMRATRLAPAAALKQGGRGATTGGRGGFDSQRLRGGLVAAQIAMSLALLIGAGLLVRSFTALLAVDPGFDPRGVIAADVHLPENRYPTGPPVIDFTERLLQRVAALPGVTAAGVIDAVPFGNGDVNGDITIAGRPRPRPGAAITAEKKLVGGDYFRAMRIPLRRGRPFDAHDTRGTTPVVIVNQNLARAVWPGQDPLGRRLSWDDGKTWLTVVGVVGNVHLYSLDEKPLFDTYRPLAQLPTNAFTLVARRAGDPLALAPQLRREVQALDSRQPLGDLDQLADRVAESLAQRRFQMLLIAALALLAMALASLGVYGVMAFAVQQRAPEIGVRIALGARRGQVFALVLRGSLAIAALGIAAGIAASFALGRYVEGLLYGVHSSDPVAYAVGCGTLLTVSLLAAFLPARRAAAIDPVATLRSD